MRQTKITKIFFLILTIFFFAFPAFSQKAKKKKQAKNSEKSLIRMLKSDFEMSGDVKIEVRHVGFQTEDMKDFIEKYVPDDFEFEKANNSDYYYGFFFCNMISKMEGLEPVYKLDAASNEFPEIRKDEEYITDIFSNGWRVYSKYRIPMILASGSESLYKTSILMTIERPVENAMTESLLAEEVKKITTTSEGCFTKINYNETKYLPKHTQIILSGILMDYFDAYCNKYGYTPSVEPGNSYEMKTYYAFAQCNALSKLTGRNFVYRDSNGMPFKVPLKMVQKPEKKLYEKNAQPTAADYLAKWAEKQETDLKENVYMYDSNGYSLYTNYNEKNDDGKQETYHVFIAYDE